MQVSHRWTVALAGMGLLIATASPASAGRITRGADPGFELHRIISEYRGRTSEAIAPWETFPTQPIMGETLLFGHSNVFPEGVKVETWRASEGWKTLKAGDDFTFKATVLTPEGSQGAFTDVVVRFAATKVALIQNAFVRITIQPMPGPTPTGDTVEAVTLRAP